jgi:hypothetical protein
MKHAKIIGENKWKKYENKARPYFPASVDENRANGTGGGDGG